jgi:hypothetical protein
LGSSGLSLGCRAAISKQSPKVINQALNCVKVQALLQLGRGRGLGFHCLCSGLCGAKPIEIDSGEFCRIIKLLKNKP